MCTAEHGGVALEKSNPFAATAAGLIWLPKGGNARLKPTFLRSMIQMLSKMPPSCAFPPGKTIQFNSLIIFQIQRSTRCYKTGS